MVDLMPKFIKQPLNIGAIFGADLHEGHIVLGCEFLGLFSIYFPLCP
jgi:hypothetical protein